MTASDRALVALEALGYPMIEARPMTLGRAARYAPDGGEYAVVRGTAPDEAQAVSAMVGGVVALLGERTGLLALRTLPEIKPASPWGASYYVRLRLMEWAAPVSSDPLDRLRIERSA